MSRDMPATTGNDIRVPDGTDVDVTGTALTIGIWAWPDTTGTDKVLAGKVGFAGSQQAYWLQYTAANKASFAISNGTTGEDAIGATSLSTSGWNHVVGVKNGTGAGAIRVYLNGVVDGTDTSNVSIQNNTATLDIGRLYDTGFWMFDGRLANLVLFDAALSADEVVALYRGISPFKIRPGALRGFWPLWGLGSYEPDVSRTNNNGTVNGTVPAGSNHSPTGPIV